MSPQVFAIFAKIVSARLSGRSVVSVLEIGAAAQTLLAISEFRGARRVAFNIRFDKISAELSQMEMITGNSNALEFSDESFDCVMSCSTLEHDKYFWKS